MSKIKIITFTQSANYYLHRLNKTLTALPNVSPRLLPMGPHVSRELSQL